MSRLFVNVTVPVYNEEAALAGSIVQINQSLVAHGLFDFEIVIANNASTDRTGEIAECLCRSHPSVRAIHLERKGRGGAIRQAWRQSNADILSYMDVDLSAELLAFPRLVEPLALKQADVAIGSRLLPESKTKRGLKREVLSRSYNFLIKALLRTRFSDAQCGFKAISRDALTALLPLVEDDEWFFDSELLILAEKLGYRIFELPIRWTDDPDSRVRIWRTALDDIRGLLRIRRSLARGEYRRAADRATSAAKSSVQYR